MRPELESLLYARYPHLYRQKDLSMSATSMCWGFSCADGWFAIIDALSSTITSIDPKCQAIQVKEKLASLHYYYQSKNTDSLYPAVSAAELYSTRVCEITGWPGEVMASEEGWYATLSPEGIEQIARDRPELTVEYRQAGRGDRYWPPNHISLAERRGYTKLEIIRVLNERHKTVLRGANLDIPPRMFDLADVCVMRICSRGRSLEEGYPTLRVSSLSWRPDVGMKIEIDQNSLWAAAQACIEKKTREITKDQRKNQILPTIDDEIARLRGEVSAIQMFGNSMSRHMDIRTGRIGPVDDNGKQIN